jgi:hypothetical protein
MPTRIITTDAPGAGGAGDTWGAIGGGLQGLAAIAGSAMQANAANKAAKAAQQTQGLADAAGRLKPITDADFASLPMGGDAAGGYTPIEALGAQMPGRGNLSALTAQLPAPPPIGGAPLRTASSVDVNASAPPLQLALPGLVTSLSPASLASAGSRNAMTGGGGAGFQSLFASRFPSLFPESANNMMQYGGL